MTGLKLYLSTLKKQKDISSEIISLLVFTLNFCVFKQLGIELHQAFTNFTLEFAVDSTEVLT